VVGHIFQHGRHVEFVWVPSDVYGHCGKVIYGLGLIAHFVCKVCNAAALNFYGFCV